MTLTSLRFRRPGARTVLLVLALLALAVSVLVPAGPVAVPALAGGSPTVRGAYHIHSDRSDGTGSIDEIAAAASRAGLNFIVLTDHGDGTRPPDAPQYRHGVLVIDAVELNTTGGHLVALGLQVAPYPIAGTATDVLEDVHRLGGFGIAAHPDSPRPSLSWNSWEAPIDGLEWMNGDSGWRDEGSGALARAALGYWFRAPGAMATLLDRPVELLARWDAAGVTRSVMALAAADAHARLGRRQTTDQDGPGLHLPLPGYEVAFRTFSNHVVLTRPLRGEAAADAAAVLAALTQGRSFTVVDALATPGGLEFTARGVGGAVAGMGDAIPLAGEVTLQVRLSGPPGTTLRLLRSGDVVQESSGAELSTRAEAGVYRVEAHTPEAPGTPPVPWVLSNPIYVGLPRETKTAAQPGLNSRIPARTAEATAEHGAADTSELVDARVEDPFDRRLVGDSPIGWRFALSEGRPAGQFAAVRLPVTGGLAAFDRVRFVVKSTLPMRAWVQVRASQASERWGRTFYVDRETRMVDLPLRSFLPIGSTSSAAPPLRQVDSILFVVDTLNSRPGASGSMTIADAAFVR